MKPLIAGRRRGTRGSTLIEFALVALLLCFLLLVFVDFARLMLVYNGISDAARSGVRYAIVHGKNRDGGAGIDGASGPTDDPYWVVHVVKNYASSAPLDESRLVVKVRYPADIYSRCSTSSDVGGGSNAVGWLVRVKVEYPFDPFLGYFPLGFTLRACSQGIMAF